MRLGEILTEAGLITKTELNFALKDQSFSYGRLGQILVRYKFINEAELIAALAKQCGVYGIDILHEAVDKEALQVIPKDLIKKHRVMPIGFEIEDGNKKLIVAVSNPKDLGAIDEIAFVSGYGVCPVFAKREDLAVVIRHYHNIIIPANLYRFA